MRTYRQLILLSILLIVGTFLSITLLQAQRLCEALVEAAFEQATINCSEQDGELACYAYDNLSVSFFNSDGVSPFTPSNILELPVLHTMVSSPIDLEEDEWGIAYLQVQSNLPDALENSSVRVIMMGDVLLENAVDETFDAPLDTLLIAVSQNTVIRETPDETSLIGDVRAGTVLEAVGKTEDGMWIAISESRQIRWVDAESVTSTVSFDVLPVIGEGGTTNNTSGGAAVAFDTLFFETGGESDCQEAPNMLVVQGPNDQSVDVTLNGVPIRIGSTIGLGLEKVNGETVMWVTVISGKATLFPGTPREQIIPEGHFSYAPIETIHGSATAPIVDYVTGLPIERFGLDNGSTADVNDVTDASIINTDATIYYRHEPSGDFTEPQPLRDTGTGFMSKIYYQTIGLIPESMLNYRIIVPLPEPTPQPIVVVPQVNAPVVLPTATLFVNPDPAPVANSCESGNANYCDAGQPWGDGRCNTGDPNTTDYMYKSGWYHAAKECGIIDAIPVEYGGVPTPTPFPTKEPDDEPIETPCRVIVVLQGSPYTGPRDIDVASDNYDGTGQALGTCIGLEIHGNDAIVSLIDGGVGDDIIYGYGGRDDIVGGAGDDIIYAHAGGGFIQATSGNDTIYGGDDLDQINGGAGNDLIYGGAGNDALRGDSTVSGGSGNDTIFGEDGNDYIYGDAAGGNGTGNDVLDGGNGDDNLFGDSGTSGFILGSGDDTITGGPGTDTVAGPGNSQDVYLDTIENNTSTADTP